MDDTRSGVASKRTDHRKIRAGETIAIEPVDVVVGADPITIQIEVGTDVRACSGRSGCLSNRGGDVSGTISEGGRGRYESSQQQAAKEEVKSCRDHRHPSPIHTTV